MANLFKTLTNIGQPIANAAIGGVKTAGNAIGHAAEGTGHALGLPELGLSEAFGVHNNYANSGGGGAGQPQYQASTGTPTSATYAGGGGAYNANIDPGQVAAARAQTQQLLAGLNSAYDSIFGAVDQNVAAKRAQLDNNYQQQFNTQDQNLQNTQDSTNNIYAGRGAANSSYNAKAQGQNVDAYNTDRANLVAAQNQNYSDLGKFAATTKAQLSADRPQVDLSQYNDVNALNGLRDQLDQHIKSLQTQQVGLGTDAQFQSSLNAIAPGQSNLEGQLADKLATLSKSSAPDSAKQAIAQGYIKLAGADPNYWQNYFSTLTAPSQVAPATVQ